MDWKQIYSLMSTFVLQVQKIILLISSLLIVLGLGITVTMRYFIKTDFFALEELLIIPAFWLYFIGASYGAHERYHVIVDFINTYASKKVADIVQLITVIVTVVVSVIMTVWAFDYVMWSFQSGSKSSAWKIPLYIAHSSVLVGFLLMTIYFTRDFVIDLLTILKNEQKQLEGDNEVC